MAGKEIEPMIATPPNKLEAHDVVYQVEGARLLDRVSLNAEGGQIVGLVGPNGAGKSTFLRTLSGLLNQQEGTVSLSGQYLESLSAREVARVLALVPQIAPYTHGFTSLELVLMGRYPHMRRFQIEGAGDQRIAREAMRQTESEPFADRTLDTLSGGERQRVFVARALAQQPRVLLLDEPTSNLDILHQLKVLDLVRGLVSEGMTAIAAIHDLHLAARYCHSLVLLSGGRVLAEGPPETVLSPDNIETAFGVRAVVYPDPMTGALTLSLMGPARTDGAAHGGLRTHVVCGGGTGARVMYDLQQAGFTVTAGALGAGDTDRTAADILGIEYVPVPAFGGIDDEAHSRHLSLVAAADCAVLCETPIGANNLQNLEALREAKAVFCLGQTPLGQRDFTRGAAQRLLDEMPNAPRFATWEKALAALLERAREADRVSDEPHPSTTSPSARRGDGVAGEEDEGERTGIEF